MPHFRPTRVSRDRRHASGRTAKSVLVMALAGSILGVATSALPTREARAQAATTARPAAQTAAADTSPDALLAAAGRALTLLDAGNYAPLWQDMPPSLQSRFTREKFIADMASTRQAVGALRQRTWSNVNRLRYAAPTTPQGVPAGLYANVEMSSTTTDGRSFIERVSFRIESDGGFRFTGYVPRQLVEAGGTLGVAR